MIDRAQAHVVVEEKPIVVPRKSAAPVIAAKPVVAEQNDEEVKKPFVAPVQTERAVPKEEALPEGEDETPSIDRSAMAAAAPSPSEKSDRKKTYYSYSEAEIDAMRGQSKEFKKLDDQLRKCTRRSEASIERREEIPTEIAKIRMSPGGLNAKKEKKIQKLKAEKERLETQHQNIMRSCGELEAKLTSMLSNGYEAEVSVY